MHSGCDTGITRPNNPAGSWRLLLPGWFSTAIIVTWPLIVPSFTVLAGFVFGRILKKT